MREILTAPDARYPHMLTIRFEIGTEVTRWARADEAFASIQGLAAMKGWAIQGDEHMGHLGVTHGTIDGFLVKAFYEIETDGDR